MTRFKLLIIFLLIFNISKADLIINSSTGTGCSSLSVSFVCTPKIVGSGFDFNTGILPSGWKSSPYVVTGNYCFAESKSNSPYFWATVTDPNKIRFVSTNEINVSIGGVIQFDMRYGSDDRKIFHTWGVNKGSAGCEDPDLPTEGVFLQYSLDGITWTTIDTWAPQPNYATSPNGINLYQWNTFTYIIPDAAKSTKTKIRWYQPQNSGKDYDNWGLDDINISIFKSVVTQEWDFGDGTTSTDKEPNHTFQKPGTYTISLKVTDSDNTIHKKSFIHTIVENIEPTINSIKDIEVFEDCGICTINLTGITDGDMCIGQELSFQIVSSNNSIIPNPTIAYTQYEETGILSFTPNTNMNGYTDITLVISDDGCFTGGISKSTTVNFRIKVLPVNDPPIGKDLVVNMYKNETYRLMYSDLIYFDIENNLLAAALVTKLPTKGILKANGNPIIVNQPYSLKQIITYTPSKDEIGSPYSKVTFKLIDEDGGVSIKENILTFNVLDNNSTPISNNDSYLIYINNTLDHLTQGTITQNDTDSDIGDIISINNYTQPQNGSLVINKDGTFLYTPNLNFCGTDSARYTITDGIKISNSALIKITVDTARWNGNGNFSSLTNWNGTYLPISTDNIKVETGDMYINSIKEVKSLFLLNNASVEVFQPYKFTINGFFNNFGGILKSNNKAPIIIKGNLLKNNVIKSKNSSTIIIRSEIKY